MNENLLIVFYNLSIELSIFMLEFNHLSQYKYYSNVDFTNKKNWGSKRMYNFPKIVS